MPSDIKINGFEIVSELGEGGMATVYLAKQISLNRLVAIKVFHSELAKDPNIKQRFLDEGKMAGSFSHKNILQIFDTTENNGRYFIIMEYVRGGTLKEMLATTKKGLDKHEASSLALQLAAALAYAHEKGIIHRDIKPDNILLREDGSPVISDFGIAKDLASTANLTNTGMFIGTAYYTSPEQFGGDASAQSDLYSLGILFYEMLTKSRPFEANDPLAVALKHASDPIPALPSDRKEFQPIIEKLCAKKSKDRYKNANEFIEALQALSRPDTAEIRNRSKQKKRNKNRIILASILVLINVVSWSYYSWQNEPAPKDSPTPSQVQNMNPEQAKIQRLLKTANLHLELGSLIEPEGFNAHYAFKQILGIDPTNPLAMAGMDEISKALLKRTRNALASNDNELAEKTLLKALEIKPNDATLLKLKRRLQWSLPIPDRLT